MIIKTVLVVDDSQEVRETIKHALNRNGFNTITAKSGEECLSKLKEIKPDLILIDIKIKDIPINEIISNLDNIKTTILIPKETGEEEKKELEKNEDVIGFIEKPFDINKLIEEVEKTMEKKVAHDIIDETKINQKVLLFIPNTNKISNISLDILKLLTMWKKQKIIYITLQKSRERLMEVFNRENITTENIYFVDCITGFFRTPEETQNTKFVSAPYELDKISESIKYFMDKNTFIIFDSLSTLLDYGYYVPAGMDKISKFINKFSEKLKKTESKILFLSKEEDKKMLLIEESIPIYDKILYWR